MRKSLILVGFLAALLCASNSRAQNLTTVDFDSGSQLLYANAAKTTLLSAGVAATANDGAMLQLGYYNQATSTNPFAGTFVSLAGRGSANTGFGNISIGDAPADTNGANGTFALSLTFNSTSSTTGNNLPAAGQQLAILFYNNTTLANSTAYNGVSDSAWLWKAPANPPSTVTITLDQSGLVFLGGAGSAFYTSQAVIVPEPATYGLVVGGLLAGVIFFRRGRFGAV